MSDYSSSPIEDGSPSSSVPPILEKIERRPVDLAEKEDMLLGHLFEMIKKFAPHMRDSFVLDDVWWEINRDNCSLHVRFVSTNCLRMVCDTGLIVDVQICSLPSTSDDCRRIL
jgi:hypothetical protein